MGPSTHLNNPTPFQRMSLNVWEIRQLCMPFGPQIRAHLAISSESHSRVRVRERGMGLKPEGSSELTGAFSTYAYQFFPPSKPIGSSKINLPCSGSYQRAR